MTESVTRRQNSLVPKTRPGIGLSAFQKNGFVTVTLTVLMELMKTPLYTRVLCPILVLPISSRVAMDDVSIWYVLVPAKQL